MKSEVATWPEFDDEARREAIKCVGLAFWKTLTKGQSKRMYFQEHFTPESMEMTGVFGVDDRHSTMPDSEWDAFFQKLATVCPHCNGTGRIE